MITTMSVILLTLIFLAPSFYSYNLRIEQQRISILNLIPETVTAGTLP